MTGCSLTRRSLAIGMPLLLLACGERELPPAPPRLDGYAWLTPLRLNVADVEVVENTAGSRADPPAPIIPAVEVARMGRDRVVPSGTTNRARFTVETASLVRSGDSIAVLLRARLDVLDNERPVAFAVAEVRRNLTGAGSSAAARARAAETVMIRAMEDLNVEFELQVRRNLRDWLLETTPAAPVLPLDSPGGIQRQDLPQG
ncbi:hypothetical protein J8J14_19820 [Roseomonas sp. SSH11]|uniref:Lipoprotein n=1 Tax=Pararoseomonas baculiformis TaxID=2820812 RepID=A0ABS4AJH0_9PROT|nr:hypothetical protein [Pararoseomonas baculiformis]MBP0447026.1 hypothetical protein [Pararoseomonas baculiformis]